MKILIDKDDIDAIREAYTASMLIDENGFAANQPTLIHVRNGVETPCHAFQIVDGTIYLYSESGPLIELLPSDTLQYEDGN